MPAPPRTPSVREDLLGDQLADLTTSTGTINPHSLRAVDPSSPKPRAAPSPAAPGDVPDSAIPPRQVRGAFDEHAIVVYQAYSPTIADPALAAGRFVAPFKLDRMTWIKPSFLWMMYRSGWATKPGQERVLAVTIIRDGFEWALANSCLSHYDPATYSSEQAWSDRKIASPVRVQWDPERNLELDPFPHRAIQIGLSGKAVRHYVNDWIVRIDDATDLAHEIRQLVTARELDRATHKLPFEQAYPLSEELTEVIGATMASQQAPAYF